MTIGRSLPRGLAASAALTLALTSGGARAAAPDAAAWKSYLTDDLLPYFTADGAFGDPEGAFPTNRCADGALIDPSDVCADYWAGGADAHTLVSQSRLVFSYGVAYHMTGEKRYLDLARAGAAVLFDDFQDPTTGLFFTARSFSSGETTAGFNTVQKQSYGLLGPAFLYYLTRDETLLGRIETVSAAIDANYGLSSGEVGFSRIVGQDVQSARLVDTLDPLNAYTMIMARATGAQGADWTERAHALAQILVEAHWDPASGLFDTDLASTTNVSDYGHAAKSLWFIAMAGSAAGDAELVQWAKAQGAQLFAKAYDADADGGAGAWNASWAEDDSIWWISAELDQLLASLSLGDAAAPDMLAATQEFWLTHFVDETWGGIFQQVDDDGNVTGSARKQYEWKSGFHSFEHALVSYIGAATRETGEVDLWFALGDDAAAADLETAYLFDAETAAVQLYDLDGMSAQLVSFSALSFAPVPVPAAGALLAAALAPLAFGARRRPGARRGPAAR